MKKLLLAFLFVVLFSSITLAEAPFHIGIMTDTVSQGEDEYRGAERAILEYGDVKDGGMISHLVFPDNFMTEIETTISLIVSWADDPKIKAIVMQEAVPGAVEAYRKVREIRPDILLFAGMPQEDPVMIAGAADLCVSLDNISRGYLMILGAKKIGADTFVHISFPRHLSSELTSRRRDIMIEACKDLGLKFVDVGAPDPTSEVGIGGAQQYILEKFPAWLEEYGQKANFFTTNGSLEEPLVKRVAEMGGFYAESTMPSPTRGYPGALGIEIDEADKGNWPNILKKVEAKVIEVGAGGRMGCWVYSSGYCNAIGLVEHAKRVIEGKSELLNPDDLLAAYGQYSPGADWRYTYYVDANDVVRKNFLMLLQDTYIFGKGYQKQTSEVVPEKYYDKNIGKK